MQISLKDARCTAFQTHAPVEFLKDGDQGKFKIQAYTGAVVNRWWGKLAIDVNGIQAKQTLPVLLNHDRSKIVGHSIRSWADKSFWVEGSFSQTTPHAAEVKALAGEGFPWQASIGVAPLKIVKVDDGKTMKVNGLTVKGPAEVWLESEVFETSFVPLGADDNTSVQTFTEDAQPSLDSLAKASWDSDPEIRAEFGGVFERYLAFRKADAAGLVRIARPNVKTFSKDDFTAAGPV